MSIEIRLIDDLDGMRDLGAAWAAVAEVDASTPFQTFQWHLAWWEHVGRYDHRVRPHMLAFLDHGVIRALAPLAIESRGEEHLLRFSSDPWADYQELLVDCSRIDPDAVHRALGAYLKDGLAEGRWDRVELRELPADSRLAAFLDGGACGADGGLLASSMCPRLDLEDAKVFERALSLHEYSVKQRRLQRLGRLECRHHVHPGRIAERMPEFIAMHLRQWMNRPDRGLTFDQADMIRFYECCIPLLGGAGQLMLTELLLDTRPIAYYLGFIHRRIFWGYRTTFDTALRKHSPGHVMHRFMFRFLRQQGYQVFDFMRLDQPYKRRYASRIVQNWDFVRPLGSAGSQ